MNNSFEVIDNFLPNEDFEKLKNFMTGDKFPWFYTKGVGSKKDGIYFTHSFYQNYSISSTFSYLVEGLVNKLNPAGIIRIKGNCYPKTEKLIEHDSHIDYEFPHQGFIFYVNTNNGYTKMKDGKKIESIANRGLFFNSSLKHCSSTCTDEDARININFNYVK
jgi:hypothetical protein